MSRFRFIDEHRGEHSVRRMCATMGVSRSGYHKWRKRPLSRRAREDGKLLETMKQVHKKSKGTYGSPRLHQELLRLGHGCGRHRVARLMREAGLQGVPRRKFKRTTRAVAGRPVAPDRLNRNFGAKEPNKKWVADITYVPTQEGWLYLAAMLDLFSRRIVGWSMQSRMTQDVVVQALNMALRQRRPGAGLIHHSDRGAQYTSAALQTMLVEHEICASMGSKGDCYDNATMESFFGSLKRECVHRRRYPTRSAARTDLFEYIEIFYNRHRLHSSLDYVSPAEFEALHAMAP